MRIIQTLAIVASLVLAAGCASEHGPATYVTPSGQVISTGPDGRTAADRALETSLRAELNSYGNLAATDPNVQFYAKDGAVTITGPVQNERERQMIDAMVRNTAGVRAVNDQLQVAYPPTGVYSPGVYSQPAPISSPPPVVTPGTAVVPGPYGSLRVQPSTVADQPVAQRIVDQIRNDSIPPEWLQNVTINVTGGAAYLQGAVSNQQAHQAIVSAVQRVPGVTAVYDQLLFR